MARRYLTDLIARYLSLGAGLNLNPQPSELTSPVNGDIWYNSTLGKFRARQGGISVDLIQSGGGGTGNVPTGGSAGQVLAKSSDVDYDASWKNAPKGVHYPLDFSGLAFLGTSIDQSVNAVAATTVTLAGNTIDWSPFLPINDLKISEIGVYVSTAVSGNIELGIYEASTGATGGAALIRSTGLTSNTTGLKSYVIPGDFTFEAGKAYFLACGVSASVGLAGLTVAAMMPINIITLTGTRCNIRRTTSSGVLPANASGFSAPFASATTAQFRLKLAAS